MLTTIAAVFALGGPSLAHPYAPAPSAREFLSDKGRIVRELTRAELDVMDRRYGAIEPPGYDERRREFKQDIGGDEQHPSSLNRPIPVMEPPLEIVFGGHQVRFSIADTLYHYQAENLPDITSETQFIRLPIPQTFQDGNGARVRISLTLEDITNHYFAEALWGAPHGELRGQSYTIPALMAHHPIPWWWDGGTTGKPIFFTSQGFTWTLGSIGFDGVFDPWDGEGGAYDGFTNGGNPGLQTVLEGDALAVFEGREFLNLYFAPVLVAIFDSPSTEPWPEGIRCEGDGSPQVKGEEVGVGHGGLRPWGTWFKVNREDWKIYFDDE